MREAVRIPVFADALVDRRDDEQIANERAVVERQVAKWLKLRYDPQLRADGIRALQDRRARRPDLVAFEAVDNDGADTLVVAGELLIDAGQFRRLGQQARARIAELGLVAAPVAGLPSLLRLIEGDPCTPTVRGRTVDVFRDLRKDEIPVHPSYIAPLGMIRKAQGGAENSGWTQVCPTPPKTGPKVVVIDTGVAQAPRSDGWLAGLAVPGAIDLLDMIPAPDGLLDLGAGHGEFVAGAIQQVAPAADLHVVQAMDTDGIASEAAVAAAIVAAAQNGAKILNLSFGTDTIDGNPPVALLAGIRDAIAVDPDILMVCAAGNFGDDRRCWPAAFTTDPEFARNVVSVAALRYDTASDTYVGAEWSSYGEVTCSTNGQGVVSTYVVGTESPLADMEGPDTFTDPSWAIWNGTSFAAPQIAGAVVATLQNPAHSALTPFDALDQVVLGGAPTIAGYGRAIRILPS